MQDELPLWDDFERREVGGHVSASPPVNLMGPKVTFISWPAKPCGRSEMEMESKEAEWQRFQEDLSGGVDPRS